MEFGLALLSFACLPQAIIVQIYVTLDVVFNDHFLSRWAISSHNAMLSQQYQFAELRSAETQAVVYFNTVLMQLVG